MHFDHIGLFVEDLSVGREQLSSLFDIARYSEVFEDPLLCVRVQFGWDQSGICYELVAPFGEKNPVSGVLRSGRNILNHVAYRASTFDDTLERLVADGARQLAPPKPAVAFQGARVVFLLTPLNFILELVELTA